MSLKSISQLTPPSGQEMPITVRKGCFYQFDDMALAAMIPPPIVIFAGIVYLATTSATKVYMNLDIPEVCLIRRRFEDQNKPVKILKVKSPKILAEGSGNELQFATLAEHLTFDPQEIQRIVFKTKVTIDEVDVSDGWYYNACHICNRKASKISTVRPVTCILFDISSPRNVSP
ncbi:hypothetical protein COLO4_15243 [Corchorus olitorius]|uniref:Uncharacterized protein n=1 Tax=Corchorus olitorius TaxID=93759 RepID=A0A1R3JP09_9ROSI|nr:hypothetical protein COLO4_15243 [Corchorus olitorius]